MTQTVNNQNDFWDFLRILALIMTGLFAAVMMSAFCGCKSTHVAEYHSEKTADTLVHELLSDTSLNTVHEATLYDSLHHQVSDTTISKHWESNDTVVSSNVERFVNRRDSMAVHIDSLGQPTYYYYTYVHEREVHHDSVKIRNTIIDSTYQSRSLMDELKKTRIINDSLRLYYTRLDSIYLAYRDSVDNSVHAEVIVKPSLWERIKNQCYAFCTAMAIITALCLVSKWTLNKSEPNSPNGK